MLECVHVCVCVCVCVCVDNVTCSSFCDFFFEIVALYTQKCGWHQIPVLFRWLLVCVRNFHHKCVLDLH